MCLNRVHLQVFLTTKILTFVCLPAAVDASTSDSARARVSVFVLRTSQHVHQILCSALHES